ncbi:MAG: hypothetical protein AAF191_10750, partial [Verrucomicrobiota bacterium]
GMSELGFRPPYTVTPVGSFAQQLNMMGKETFDRDRTNFVINLLTLRGAGKQLGVEAGPELVEETIKGMEAFQDPGTGTFQEAAFRDFVEMRLGGLSLTELELREMIADFVQFEKTQKLVASGLIPSEWEVEQEYRQQYEELIAWEVFVKPEESSGEFTEEQISEYFENNKQFLLSEEKRAVDYLAFPLPERGEGEEFDEDAWKDARMAEAKNFNRIFKSVGEALDEGSTIEAALSAADGKEVVSLEPFSMTELPEQHRDEIEFIGKVFDLDPASDNPLGAAETQKAIYLFWLTKHEKPRELTLEEARDQVTERLKEQSAEEALTRTGDEAREKLVAELSMGGKTFEAAAASAGLEAKALKPFSRFGSPDDSDFASTITQLVRDLKGGELSDPQVLGDGSLLVFLESTTLPPRDSAPEDKQLIADSIRTRMVNQTYNAWFTGEREKAKATLPVVRVGDELQTLSIERLGR